ncbi:acyltransferase family protein [Ruminiclostridium herbifermentans]|uniref:Acyltransferase family protein n=1 Tax=Ruminiclostridium herbifermentans TaxID=2488810 RepID=A0A4V6YE55_9FIRM|nr:acyltransferase family protein [Ruminiclostridium herbifermentans]QNU66625.1 acyltransferase family protein [Ruminiclostridium herbifermentans]
MQHNEDLDFLKGIGIVLVVLGHCFTTALETKYYSIRILKDFIYTFHMPLFFIVSGYLQGLRPYSINKLKNFSTHQIRKLFLPYIAWSIVLYIFYYFLNSINIITIQENIRLNPIYLIYDILAYNIRTGNVLWFVYILCIISIVSYIFHNLITKKGFNIAFLVAVLFLGVIANIYLRDELFVLKRFLVMWIYYEVGVYIGIFIKDINIKANTTVNIILMALYPFIFIFYLKSNSIFTYGLKVICALLAVFILYNLSKYNNCRTYRIFNYLGKRTSYIYYLHNPYIVLVTVTGLNQFTKLNIAAAIAIAFILGIIIPLIIGNLILSRIKMTKFILLGERYEKQY